MGDSENPSPAWRAKLRFGKSKTRFSHYGVIAEGRLEHPPEWTDCSAGPAYFSMSAWASSIDEAADMIEEVSAQVGFSITGNIEVFESEATEPPRDVPYGYKFGFAPFDE